MRVGLLGAGRIGAHHAETLAGLDEVEHLVIADTDPERARSLAEKLTGSVALDHIADVFAAGRVDAVCIAAATSAHAELLHLAADAGLPTFCEKPLAADVAGTLRVLEHVERTGIALHVGFQRRFDAGFVAARQAVADGSLGTLHRVRAVTADPQPPHLDYLPHSGGIYRDCHIHDFDAVGWVTGQPVVEAWAVGANRGHRAFADCGDVDTSLALLRLADDTLVTVEGSRYNGAGYDVRLELAGTEASVVAGLDPRTPLHSLEPEQRACPQTRPYTGFLDRFAAAYAAEMTAFVAMAAGRAPSPCTGREALAALYVAEACTRSLAEGRPIRVAQVEQVTP